MSVEQDVELVDLGTFEEEALLFYPLEDLIWEYNERIQMSRGVSERYALSLQPPEFDGEDTFIKPMTEAEIQAMDSRDQRDH